MRVPSGVLAACCCAALLAGACDDGGGGSAGGTERDGDTATAYAGYESEVYADPANWLCRPDVDDDFCDEDLDATVVRADGTVEVEEFEPAADPPIDCFYVYPTVSVDPGVNSDLVPDPETEGLVVRNQVARLASECRVFAPVYEQFTLTALLGVLGDSEPPAPEGEDPRDVAYKSALDAWKHYMANDNDGRGVVLVGHSQGSGILTQLIGEEIDGNEALRGQLVSAILAGSSLTVPAGDDVGGDFENVSLCRAPDDVGCAISYASFRSTAPPPPDSVFGRTEDSGPAACTNPAALEGGAATAEPYFETDPQRGAFFEAIGLAGSPSPAWVDAASGSEIETPWVKLPDFVQTECVERDGFAYLEVTVNGDPSDPRIDDIGGDTALASFGLHVVDVNLVMGDLVDVVRRQAEAYSNS